VKCSALSKKAPNHPHSQNDELEFGATSNIIFNLAHLGLSIEDSKYFDLSTYFELVQLEMNVISGKDSGRRASQSDIDAFLI
jgi:hypothetical protein